MASQSKILAKRNIFQTLNIPFQDEMQGRVEFFFMQGYDAQEIMVKLSLSSIEAKQRFFEALRRFRRESLSMQDEWVGVEVVKTLRSIRERRSTIQERIDRLTTADAAYFPHEEYKALRAEDTLRIKVIETVVKRNKNKVHKPDGTSPDFSPEAMRQAKSQNEFREISAEYRETTPHDSMTEEILQNLGHAVQEDIMFRDVE
jgi:hypothetical protein